MLPLTANDQLLELKRWSLERDDDTDPNGRIYRDAEGNIYHSVTRILKETSNSKAALEAWIARLGEERAYQERDTAARRGTLTHNSAEYVLRTAKRMAEQTAKKRGSWYIKPDGRSGLRHRSPSGPCARSFPPPLSLGLVPLVTGAA